jgi:hypothetical protein
MFRKETLFRGLLTGFGSLACEYTALMLEFLRYSTESSLDSDFST